MSTELRHLMVWVTVCDQDEWSLESATRYPGGIDEVMGELRQTLRNAGKDFVAARPDIFADNYVHHHYEGALDIV